MGTSTDGFMDGKLVEFPCETCDATLQTTVGEARRASALECPNGHPIAFDADEYDASIRQAELRVQSIMNSFTF